MKIYLAGKMNDEHGSWRDAVVGSSINRFAEADLPRWKLMRDVGLDGWNGERVCIPWPVVSNRFVLNVHDYTGPYRTDVKPDQLEWKNFGEFHGSVVQGCHGASNGEEDGLIVSQCIQAITRADMVFAYINSPDCFGTLVELGIARGMGIYTVAAFDDAAEWDWSDYWFVKNLVNATVTAPPSVSVGEKPELPELSTWASFDSEPMQEWNKRRDAETARIRGMVLEAVLQWTARPDRPAPISLVRAEDTEPYIRAIQEAAQSFSQISRWSSDPRVRNEAQRMLKRITA